MEDMKEMKAWVTPVIIAMVILVLSFFGYTIYHDATNRLSGKQPLPQHIDIAYKEIQVRGMAKVTTYAIIDTAGYEYFVTEDKFQTIQAPQKIGEGLYRMPDGSLITSTAKENR